MMLVRFFFGLDTERSWTPTLIADVVIAVSQGDFFGSKICQGTRTRLGAKFLTPMRPRELYRRTSGAFTVTVFPGGLISILNLRCILLGEHNAISKR
jgi:hypothetical protein